jgi:hypothetical protein
MSRILVSACIATLALAWSASGHAQGPSPTPRNAPGPSASPSQLTFGRAAPPPARDVPTEGETYTTRPNWLLLGPGIGIFGGTYATSLVVGLQSRRVADERLYVPLVGPWIDLANRNCAAVSCSKSENLYRALIVGSGVLQTAGAVMITLGVLVPRKERTLTGLGYPVGTWHVTPARIGATGDGIAVDGTF